MVKFSKISNSLFTKLFQSFLDETKPIQLDLLKKAIDIIYSPTANPAARNEANSALSFALHRPDMYQIVDPTMESNTDARLQFNVLNSFVQFINERWEVCPPDIRSHFKEATIKWMIMNIQKNNQTILIRLNLILSAIAKYEWPESWPTMIKEFFMFPAQNLNIQTGWMTNCFTILQILSEQISDLFQKLTTSTRARMMTQQLQEDYENIYPIIVKVLSSEENQGLVLAVLSAVKSLIKPLTINKVITEETFVPMAQRLFPQPQYTVPVFSIFAELAHYGNPIISNDNATSIFVTLVTQLAKMIPNNDIMQCDEKLRSVFSTSMPLFLERYSHVVEQTAPEPLQATIQWLLPLTETEEDITPIISLWLNIAHRLYNPTIGPMQFYSEFLMPHLRRIILSKMEQPVNVMYYVDENGTVHKDKTESQNYYQMRELLVYMFHIDKADSFKAIQEKLSELQEDPNIANLNSICWSVGAMVDVLASQGELPFVMTVLEFLISFNQAAPDPALKTASALGLMHICANFAKYLQCLYPMLRVIIQKLLDFIVVKDQAIQESCVDALNSAIRPSVNELVKEHPDEKEPFINQIFANWSAMIPSLPLSCGVELYDTFSLLIKNVKNPDAMGSLIVQISTLLNGQLAQLSATPAPQDQKWCQLLKFVMDCNAKMAGNLNDFYLPQFLNVMPIIMPLYSHFGAVSLTPPMYEAKQSIVCFLLSVVDSLTLHDQPKEGMAGTIFGTIIPDYVNNHNSRVPDVVDLMNRYLSRQSDICKDRMPEIVQTTIIKTIEMISPNHENFAEFRMPLSFCIATIFTSTVYKNILPSFPGEVINMMVQALMWVARNPDPDISRTALDQINRIYSFHDSQGTEFSRQFIQNYSLVILSFVFELMVDNYHKFNLMSYVTFLRHLFTSQAIATRIDQAFQAIVPHFPRRAPQEVAELVGRLAHTCNEYTNFKNNLLEYLVISNQYMPNDPALREEEIKQAAEELKEQNKTVAGLVPAPDEVSKNLAAMIGGFHL